MWAHVTFPRVRSFYLRVKTREEGTPWHGIRRHVDLIDDHCHASCQMDFLLAIRRSPRSSFIQSFVFPRAASTWHFASRTTRSCSSLSNVLIRTLRFEIPWSSQSSRWSSTGEIISTGTGKAWTARHSSQVKTCARRDRFSLIEFVMAQDLLATSIKTFLPRITWRFLRTIEPSSSMCTMILNRIHQRYFKKSIVLLSGESYLLPDLTIDLLFKCHYLEIPFEVYLGKLSFFISSASNGTH